MIHAIKGDLQGKGERFAVIVTRTDSDLEKALYKETVDTLIEYNTGEDMITTICVPTVWDLPLALKKVIRITEYDAVIIIGVHPLKEENSQGIEEIRKALADISLKLEKPVVFTITGKTAEEDLKRQGREAVIRVLEMTNLIMKIHGHEIELNSTMIV